MKSVSLKHQMHLSVEKKLLVKNPERCLMGVS